MDITVGIGDFKISGNRNDVLKTYALASCIAVTAYSPAKKVAGMLHLALPEPKGREKDINPAYYATTGVPLMINKMCRDYGCLKHELKVRLYGGADSVLKDDIFHIGRKNIRAVSKTLENMDLTVSEADLGGNVSRTLSMDVEEGEIKISEQLLKI